MRELLQRFSGKLRIPNNRMPGTYRIETHVGSGGGLRRAGNSSPRRMQPFDIIDAHIGDDLEVAHDSGFRPRFRRRSGCGQMHRDEETQLVLFVWCPWVRKLSQ